MRKLSHAKVYQLFQYDEEKGKLYWLESRGSQPFMAEAGKIEEGGYCRITVNGKLYPRAVLVWLYITGEMPKGRLYHRNGLRHDDRFDNLTVNRQLVHSD